MTDLIVPSKRPRVPSFTDKHSDYSETQAATTAVSDWLQEKEMDEVEVKNFLELCGLCKKNLRHDKDVFMYGYLGAFCSKKCRAKQMACDIFRESSRGIAKTKKGRTCEGIKPIDSNDEVLGNRDRISSPRFYI